YRPLAGLALHTRHSAAARGIAPGRDLRVTPSLRTPDGLELVNAEFLATDSPDPTPAAADIRLIPPDGPVADRTSSGFPWGRFCTHSVRVPSSAAGRYTVRVTFPSGPLGSDFADVCEVRAGE